MLVAFQPADVGLIDFDRTGEGTGIARQRLADPMQHEPCCLLADPEIPVELHAGDALQVRDGEVDSKRPILE